MANNEQEGEKFKSKYKLKKLVDGMAAIKGRHTELVTVYVPANYSLTEIIAQLRSEQSTAENIKSKPVRKNVTSALDKIIRHLQLYKKTPEHGLAIFCGNISEREGAADIQITAIEPPEEIKVKMYWCDQRFVLEPLQEMIAEKEIYGIINLDKSEADIALLVGKRLEPLVHKESIVPGKTRAGGQCLTEDSKVQLSNGKLKFIKDVKIGDVLRSYDFKQKRFIKTKCIDKWYVKKHRILELKLNGTFINSSEEHLFFTNNGPKIAKELTKEDFLLYKDSEPVQIESIKINKGLYKLVDISVENENFIANGLIVHNSSARFSRIREGLLNDWLKEIGEAANKIFEEHKEVIGIIVSGPGPVKDFFLKEDYIHADVKKKVLGTADTSYTGEHGLEETIIRGEELIKEASIFKEKNLLQKFLNELPRPGGFAIHGLEKTQKALELGAVDTVILSEKFPQQIEGKDAIEYFEEKVENYGTKLVVVSDQTREGLQFRELSGIGALLRYRIE